jgi:NAD(P)-dependent dehydrogenase (short-subunit alcohol dehydrogenase family)
LRRGAKVVFGDVNVEESEKQVQKLSSDRIKFLKTDITKYSGIVALFDLALKTWKRIDVAVSNAGIAERDNRVDLELSLEGAKTVSEPIRHYWPILTVSEVPDQSVLGVNLLGSLYLARVAAVYLRQGQTKDDDKFLIFLSSIAGFKETSGMPVYQVCPLAYF